jgi:hypothetical protein
VTETAPFDGSKSTPRSASGSVRPAPAIPLPRQDCIPEALRGRAQWLNWGYVWDPEREQWRKVPQNSRTGFRASTTNSDDWATFAQAHRRAERSNGRLGIGFVFSANDPFAGVDLDNCRDPETGVIADWAVELIKPIRTYTEISVSGTGVHLYGMAHVGGGRRSRYATGEAEIYDRDRYFVVTGDQLPGTPDDVAEAQAAVDALRATLFPAKSSPAPFNGSKPNGLSDGDVIRLASEAANGDKFCRLFYNGDTSEYGGDASAADEALLCMFAFYTRDPAQLESCFARGALAHRDKWTRRADYRQRSIARALDLVIETYELPARRPSVTVHGEAAAHRAERAAQGTRAVAELLASQETPWPSLDEAALHGLAGDVVRAFRPHSEADDVSTLTAFLVLFGAACNRGPYMEVGEDEHHANLYVATVGDTSKSRKGTSLGPARRILALADPCFVSERVQGGLSSGQGLIWAIRDPIIETNRKGEEVITDNGVSDKRLVCVEEEFSAVLKQSRGKENIVSEIKRRAWDSRPELRSMTKHDPACATNPHVSVIVHITIAELRRELTDTDMANGTGNRYIWTVVKRARVLPKPGRLAEDKAKELARKTKAALDFARKHSGAFAFDEEAAETWAQLYGPLSQAQPGLVGALLARGEAQVLRLALIYALLDRSPTVTKAHLISAVALWDHSVASARFIFGDLTGDPIADRILAVLKRDGPQAQNDLIDLFGRNVPGPRLGQATEMLIVAGRIRSRMEDTGGRSRKVWELIS